MNELSDHGWNEFSNGQYYFHSYDFDVMRMIGHLIDCACILKNQCCHIISREIVPEYVLSEEAEKIMMQKKIRMLRRKIIGE